MFRIKDISSVSLCDSSHSDVSIHVWASIRDGRLEIAGQDLGPLVEKIWGDTDYEYWYNFSREDTAKLLRLIKGKRKPAKALVREFSGERGCRYMAKLCEANGIKFEFSSYV